MKRLVMLVVVAFSFLACPGSRPQVVILEPADHAIVVDSVLVKVGASDEDGIDRVEILVDNATVDTLAAEPWEWVWDVRALADSSEHTLRARAYDATGREGLSPVVTVLVRSMGSVAARNLALRSHLGTSVVLNWELVGAETSRVYFRDTLLATVVGDSFYHATPGRTGDYRVSAVRWGHESPADSGTTVPVASSVRFADYNYGTSTEKHGVHWERTTGAVRYFALVAASAESVDLYGSDWQTTYNHLPYWFVSPAYGVANDPGFGGKPMPGNWRVTGISNALRESFDAVQLAPTGPFETTQVEVVLYDPYAPLIYAVHTADDYYLVLKVKSFGLNNGQFDADCRFQTVPGLRLVGK